MQETSSQRDRGAYLNVDTVAAISTAVGGAIAMVRVSGPRSREILGRLTSRETAESSEPRKFARAKLMASGGSLIDDALFVRFACPESFTGEDLVEFHIHGGAFTASRLMEELAAMGVRQALPGEFSFRAVRNGKMTVPQAQAVADLITASNEGAVTLALEKMSGSQNLWLEQVATSLRRLAVLGEAGIDFSDQDIDEISLPGLKKQLSAVISALEQLRASYARGHRLQDGVSVAFIGLPNTGKSSFFNSLLGEDRSIVSDIAGTTRDVIREKLTLKGRRGSITLRLEDTAGLRATDNRVEQMGIERTRKSVRDADLVLFLIDATQPIASAREQWLALCSFAPNLGEKTVGVLTKMDLADSRMLDSATDGVRALGFSDLCRTSSLTGEGIAAAAGQIADFCESFVHRGQGEILLTRIDQVSAVSVTLDHLTRAQAASEIELFAADIRQSLHALGPLIGETLTDDILGKIFSDFCIGK